MNIELETINMLVNMLEGNRDNLSELDYDKACDALKELYSRSTTNFVIFLQSTENSMISKVQSLEDELKTPIPTFTINNKDRQKLLEVLWPETIRRGPRAGFVKMTDLEIKTCIAMLVSQGLLNQTIEFEEIALSQKYKEHYSNWNHTKIRLETAQTNLETFRRRWYS